MKRLLVIVFAGLLSSVIYQIMHSPYYTGPGASYVEKAHPGSFTSALEAYQDIGGKYPSTEQGLEALVRRPHTSPRPRDWVQASEEIPLDPWGTPFKYLYPGSKDPSRPEIISAGPDKMFETEDDISNQVEPR